MFGNRTATAVSILQKTYDESYLTCSTAVYYESQGNEDEAMRCWKQALEQIYDPNVNRVLPNFTPRSETEKTLVDSLRQLELQCKERIDLLEALRISRIELPKGHDSPSSGSRLSKSSTDSQDVSEQQERGWIGNGTIPAATYTDLSRPSLMRRLSSRTRTSSSDYVVAKDQVPQPSDVPPPLPARKPVPPPAIPSPDKKPSRASSPERHIMRTTLRTGNRDKTPKMTLRRQPPKSEGPGSKAAALAWNALGHREQIDPGSSPSLASEPPRRSFESGQRQWDSHSRRLVTPRTTSPAKDQDKTDINRRSGEYPFPRSASISISAASTALNALALRERDSSERRSPERDQITRFRTAPPTTSSPQTPRPRQQRDATHDTEGTLSVGGRTSSDPAMASARRSGGTRVLSITKDKTSTPTRSTKRTPGSARRTSQSGARAPPSPTTSVTSASSFETPARRRPRSNTKPKAERQREASLIVDSIIQTSESSEDEQDEETKAAQSWKKKKAAILKKLPPGVDEHAAKQILNEIVVQGDQVHWNDIAGLEIAKNALRETVVYPFLRPDLFMGLREPARGMLLFGPPGTGKTMLARAVATESKSTFFSISASSLTSKYLGESEKLVRALFALAKVLAPSIIFVDEIDSLLSQRSGSGEHEATRRIKTEFLIQWSDLQRAAAGREVLGEKEKERGDANRVLVLAATNLPWAIDEAARRRFVRRQYIPLPEAETRKVQLEGLLREQRHELGEDDIERLVGMTDGFSGSDITALAKDAAMGPLRSLGEALLHMTMDQIRPIELKDFEASLTTIRPSVSQAGLKEYEDWAKEFGERGG
ncbi:putative ATPase of the AAA+ class [Podospora fimiseda]|uniref:ATPase of the AAA+ class n=1 Tax=Podospora fimiseda TaxID=252190 RepID=A0AAN7BRK6_9PEZI|nr:putative ATPase of the AAA+ class [Podospora fimiseda]